MTCLHLLIRVVLKYQRKQELSVLVFCYTSQVTGTWNNFVKIKSFRGSTFTSQPPPYCCMRNTLVSFYISCRMQWSEKELFLYFLLGDGTVEVLFMQSLATGRSNCLPTPWRNLFSIFRSGKYPWPLLPHSCQRMHTKIYSAVLLLHPPRSVDQSPQCLWCTGQWSLPLQLHSRL